ncbi:RagB/SusD family nutrient uptake outer membrane protein [Maribellus sp. CM-23]|uniref:RagB/SusD family nutrient uptake outer membrane protein n=1 Tax=Maribellus sp. CM-23 TaxID=2781026 RepID=UPI001F3C318F|nr:RagB/SusD family nutrient uptake outer membrane protein [Maribellus sp. CM-23]MCE4567041.1 RagB/SusD family nutrient uptake outer membrane protein [Maribellus sp. CM-23]
MKERIYIYIITLLLMLSSCDDLTLEKYPLDRPSSSTFPSNQKELEAAVWGCYGSLWLGTNYGMVTPALLDVTTDIAWERAETNMQSIGNGTHDINNLWAEQLWKNYYIGIGRCNFLLENAERAEAATSPDVFKRIIAETRFIRAYYYLMLTELWSDVPLVLNSLTLAEAQMPKTGKNEIVDFILKELTEAATDLPAHIGAPEYGRIGKGAAFALKARTAIYNKKYDIALEASKAVMDLEEYEIDDNFSDMFKSATQMNSNEIIFQIPYKEGYKTSGVIRGCTSRMGGGYSSKIPVQVTVDSYDCLDGLSIDKSPLYDPENPYANRDPRLNLTIVVPGSQYMGYQFETHKDSVVCWNYKVSPALRVANQDALNPYSSFSGFVWRKYNEASKPSELDNSETGFIFIRYADVLLMYAEAKVELDQIDESVYQAINKVRQRPSVNMPAITDDKSKAELRNIIRKERKVEFAWEGLRWSDIRRWGIVNEVMNGPLYGRPPRGRLNEAPIVNEYGTPDYSQVSNKDDMRVIEQRKFNPNRDMVLPIPRIEIETNSELTQNPNY